LIISILPGRDCYGGSLALANTHRKGRNAMSVQSQTRKPRFSTWKAIELGTIPFVDNCRRTLWSKGMKLDRFAKDLLDHPAFKVAPTHTTISLVSLSLANLGFGRGSHLEDIYAAACQEGLQLCPAEVGPQLRLQYPDQPPREDLFIAMEAIPDSGNHPDVFCVKHSRGLWLSVRHAFDFYFWRPEHNVRFVFACP
jgi:hypothetical protein